MTSKDKKLILPMIKALESFESCLPKFSDDGWQELCQKVGEKSLPTWDEISEVKKRLQEIKEEQN